METNRGQPPQDSPLVVLVVEDDFDLAADLAKRIAPAFTAQIAHTLEDALRALDHEGEGNASTSRAQEPFCATIIDPGLPDGDGMQVAVELRRRRRTVPLLVMTGRTALDPINHAALLDAVYVRKPDVLPALLAFLRRVLVDRYLPEDPRRPLTRLLVNQQNLTLRQTQVVCMRIAGRPRAEVAAALGIGEEAVKKETRSAMDKLGSDTSLGEFARKLLEDSQPPPGRDNGGAAD